jgi:hypothetical protein
LAIALLKSSRQLPLKLLLWDVGTDGWPEAVPPSLLLFATFIMTSNSKTSSLKSSTNKSAIELFSSIKERAASQTSLIRQQSSSWFSRESEPSLPVQDITYPLPVMEQPSRVLLKSLNRDHFNGPYTLSSTKKREVRVSTASGDMEQFLLIPVDEVSNTKDCATTDAASTTTRKDMYYLKSFKFGRYSPPSTRTKLQLLTLQIQTRLERFNIG